MAAQERQFIKYIKVNKVAYPISTPTKSTGTTGYFILGESPVLDLGQETPVAVLRDAAFTIGLDAAPILSTLQGPCSLSGTMDDGSTIVFQQDNVSLHATEASTVHHMQTSFPRREIPGFPIVPPRIPGTGLERRLPWCFFGDLTWTLKGTNPLPTYQCTSYVNIFVLPPGLPDFFSKSGIPLNLLRHPRFLPKWMSLPQDIEWEAFVIDAVFNLHGLEYEAWSGIPRYTMFSFGDLAECLRQGRGISCLLDLWLSDLASLTPLMKLQVNCYDLAALCQAIVSLGVGGGDFSVVMHYLEPFGYIRPTRLIGREEDPRNKADNPENLCNNPFYGAPGAYPFMASPQMAPNRMPFSNHAFLSISKENQINAHAGHDFYVLDACCGPQTGFTRLEEYADTVIDAIGPYAGHYPFNRPGQASDILTGLGVDRLVTARNFVKFGPSQHAIDVTSKLAQFVRGTYHKTLRQPSLTCPVGTAMSPYISATWSFMPGQGDLGLVRISLLRFSYTGCIQEEFSRRVSTIKRWPLTSSQDGKHVHANLGELGSIQVFYDDRHSYSYLAILEWQPSPYASVTGPPNRHFDTSELKEELQSILSESLGPDKPVVRYIQSKRMTTSGQLFQSIPISGTNITCQVGSHVLVALEATELGAKSWTGYAVETEPGLVFMTQAMVEGGIAKFELLCRAPGREVVTIRIFGGNLDAETHVMELWCLRT